MPAQERRGGLAHLGAAPGQGMAAPSSRRSVPPPPSPPSPCSPFFFPPPPFPCLSPPFLFFFSVRGRDHDHAIGLPDLAARDQLLERGQRDAGVRAVEHAGAVGARRGVGELVLGGLLDDAVEALQRVRRASRIETGLPIWIAEASVGCAVTGSNVPSSALVGAVERVRGLGLRDDDARPPSRSARARASCRSPAPSALTLPRLPPGMTTQSGTSQSNCCTISIDDRLLPLDAQAVHRVGEVDAFAPRPGAGRSPCSRRSRCRARARARRWRAAGRAAPVETLPRGRMTIGRDAGGRAVGGERRRGVAGRRAGDRADRAPSAIICLTTETSTVMPRSLNDPVCELPHCLTQRSSTPSSRRSGRPRAGWCRPRTSRRRSRRGRRGHTHSFLPQTPEPSGHPPP